MNWTNYNNNYVFVNNKRYKIIGTINMGMITIKADETIQEGDMVEIFGEHISIKEAARNSHTTVYQLLSCIPKFIPRIYVKNKEDE